MVEMIVVLPLLLMMLFGVIEFGIAFQRWQIVTNAAREGARAAAVRVLNCNDAEVRSVVETYVAAAGLSPDDVSISVPDTCVPRGTPMQVSVVHDFRFPVLSGLLPSLDGVPLRGTSVMRKE
jgi:Flp pilus assembly protein TadG